MMKFKNNNTKTVGTPKIEENIAVYWFIATLSPVSFLVKYNINKKEVPKKALNNKNLTGLWLLKAKIK